MPDRYICLQTEHVRRFRCDGTQCQSRCCKGWSVRIDDSAWEKYRNIKDEAARKNVLSHIGRIGKKNEEVIHYVKISSDRVCPFLREDFLCSLQREHGEAYLSRVCRTFPRNIILAGELMERSLDLTCPVAARMVLGQRAPMEFEQAEVVMEQPMHVQRPQWAASMERLPELQYTAISLLQNRRLSLDGRLALLGFFLGELQDTGGQESWDGRMRFYASDDVGEQAEDMLLQARFKPALYLKTMFGLIEALYGARSDLQIWDAQLDYVTRVFGLENASEVPMERLVESYEAHCSSVKAALMETYSYIFENYLVNEFFGNVYPFRLPGNFVENYGTFLLGYQFLEFLLVAMAAEEGMSGFDEGVLVDRIGDFAVRIDHTPEYLDCVAREAGKRSRDSGLFWLDLLQV